MLTAEEVQELYEKVTKAVYDYTSYHTHYTYGDDKWRDEGLYVEFKVYGWSDQGEGSEWEEWWSIDSEGHINTEDRSYDTFEDFYSIWQ